MAKRRYQFGPFQLDAAGPLLFRDGQLISLAPKVADILLVLLENRGAIVKKEDLLKRVWPDTFVEEGSLARAISVLRRTLGYDPDGKEYIATVPKRGYHFICEVEEVYNAAEPTASDRVMLAVLPFQNLSGDPEQEYFTDG